MKVTVDTKDYCIVRYHKFKQLKARQNKHVPKLEKELRDTKRECLEKVKEAQTQWGHEQAERIRMDVKYHALLDQLQTRGLLATV